MQKALNVLIIKLLGYSHTKQRIKRSVMASIKYLFFSTFAIFPLSIVVGQQHESSYSGGFGQLGELTGPEYI